MAKYIIEGGMNFYEELYKSLDESDINDNNDNSNTNSKEEVEVCQITGLPLVERYVTLECSHKFNYSAIYTEICKQKYIFKSYNTDILTKNDYQKFKDAQVDYFIKCPYCRSIQFEILPYYADSEYELKYGINSLEKTKNDMNYLIKPIVDNNSYYTSYGYTFQKVAGGCCKIIGFKDGKDYFCPATYCSTVLEMNKSFCISHIRHEVKQYKIKQKALEKIQVKALEKDKKIQQKMLEKEQKMLEKEKQKLDKGKNKIKVKNTILSQSIQIGEFNDAEQPKIEGCCAILKSGPKKAQQCGAKIALDGVCLRHLSIEKDIKDTELKEKDVKG